MQKTIYEYKRVMRDLTGFLGHDNARRVSPKDLIAWKAKMIEAGLHPKTIRGAKLGPVRAILQWAVDNHLLPINPAVRVTIDVKTRAGESKRGFDDAEAAIILTAGQREADPVKRWVPLLGAYSGARLSEICQLRVWSLISALSGLRVAGRPRAGGSVDHVSRHQHARAWPSSEDLLADHEGYLSLPEKVERFKPSTAAASPRRGMRRWGQDNAEEPSSPL